MREFHGCVVLVWKLRIFSTFYLLLLASTASSSLLLLVKMFKIFHFAVSRKKVSHTPHIFMWFSVTKPQCDWKGNCTMQNNETKNYRDKTQQWRRNWKCLKNEKLQCCGAVASVSLWMDIYGNGSEIVWKRTQKRWKKNIEKNCWLKIITRRPRWSEPSTNWNKRCYFATFAPFQQWKHILRKNV